jgi:hypothetical protein
MRPYYLSNLSRAGYGERNEEMKPNINRAKLCREQDHRGIKQLSYSMSSFIEFMIDEETT